jgi:electron transfer flavoprotein beta subunit
MKELNIIVCAKQIPDPEGPSAAYKVDITAKRVILTGIPPVINPFDENALEVALRLKDVHGMRLTVLSMGEKLAKPVLRKALSAGADELILIQDEVLHDLDSWSTAYVLSAAVKKIGAYGLVLTGRQAGDWDCGQTGLIIAEFLQIPGINLAQKVSLEEGRVVVHKMKMGGYEVVKAPVPALVTVSSEVGDLRSIPLKSIMASGSKPVNVWSIEDLEVDTSRLRRRHIQELYAPKRERQCTFIEGGSPKEKGENLAIRLKADKII